MLTLTTFTFGACVTEMPLSSQKAMSVSAYGTLLKEKEKGEEIESFAMSLCNIAYLRLCIPLLLISGELREGNQDRGGMGDV